MKNTSIDSLSSPFWLPGCESSSASDTLAFFCRLTARLSCCIVFSLLSPHCQHLQLFGSDSHFPFLSGHLSDGYLGSEVTYIRWHCWRLKAKGGEKTLASSLARLIDFKYLQSTPTVSVHGSPDRCHRKSSDVRSQSRRCCCCCRPFDCCQSDGGWLPSDLITFLTDRQPASSADCHRSNE
jgi:hypothetical protein